MCDDEKEARRGREGEKGPRREEGARCGRAAVTVLSGESDAERTEEGRRRSFGAVEWREWRLARLSTWGRGLYILGFLSEPVRFGSVRVFTKRTENRTEPQKKLQNVIFSVFSVFGLFGFRFVWFG